MKIVINKCYGGFGLSLAAVEQLIEWGSEEAKDSLESRKRDFPELGGRLRDHFRVYGDDRTNSLLIRVVEELGEVASGKLGKLKVIKIPDDIEYDIKEYDGVEWVAEKHRTWH